MNAQTKIFHSSSEKKSFKLGFKQKDKKEKEALVESMLGSSFSPKRSSFV